MRFDSFRQSFLSAAALALFSAGVLEAGAAPAATTTTLTITSGGSAASSVGSGSMVTLTAAVVSSSTKVTTGQVSFCDASATYCTDIHLLGTAQLTSAGTAVLNFHPGIGSHSYRAVFVGVSKGPTTYGGSASAAVALNVAGAFQTGTTISASGSAGNYTLTAKVAGHINAPELPAPTGNVSFVDATNSQNLAVAALGPGASVNFLNSGSPVTGLDPLGLAAGDLNGDGIPDLVVTTASSDTLTVLLGNGDGTFTPAPTTTLPYNNAQQVVIADFNGDGNADLAILVEDTDYILVLLGKGDGTFTQLPPIPESNLAGYLFATGDFNGDGKADIVAANSATQTLTILLGNGDGTFTAAAPTPALSGFPQEVAVGDFNGDGVPDLAVAVDAYADGVPGSVAILLGNGDGTFTLQAATPATGDTPLSIAVGDLNGDGILDLAVSNGYDNTTQTWGTVTVLLGAGDGTFTPTAVSPAVGSLPSSIAVADFNGDGIPDLATTNAGSNTVSVLLGNGDGTFAAPLNPAAGTDPCFIAVGDFNGDGLADFAASDCYTPFGNSTSQIVVQLSQLVVTATVNVQGISPLGTGTHQVNASYAGDSLYGSSVSSTTGLTAVTPPSFAIAGTAVTVAPGATTGNTSTITIAPAGGFTGGVALTAAITASPSGAVYPPTLNFGATTPASITASAAGSATLTITTTASTSAPCTSANQTPRQLPWYAGGGAVLACLFLIGIPARRRRWQSMIGMLLLLVAFVGGLMACGSGGGGIACPALSTSGTTAGTYTVTVTGASNALTETGTVTLTVQ